MRSGRERAVGGCWPQLLALRPLIRHASKPLTTRRNPDTPKTATSWLRFQEAPPGTRLTLMGHVFYGYASTSCINEQTRHVTSGAFSLLLCMPRGNVQKNSQHCESGNSSAKKRQPKRQNHVSVSYGVEFGGLLLELARFFAFPFTIAVVLISKMACMGETNQSLTRAAKGGHPVAAGFAEAVLPKAKYESWGRSLTIKNHWPHINGAHAEPVLTHTLTPGLAQTKVLWQRQRAKIFIFRHCFCQLPNLPITTSFLLF